MSAFAKNGRQEPPPWASPADGARSCGKRFARWLRRLASPPERWDATHRLLSYAALAAAVFAIGTHGWRAAGIGAAARAMKAGSGAELAELGLRVEDARAALGRLPALREAVGKAQKRRALSGVASHSPAGQWHAISSLAAQSGMTLRSLQPGARSGDGAQAARLVRIAARANFTAFLAFLRGLPTLPSLVVPLAMRVERANDGLAIDATLQVFDQMPAAPRPAEASPASPDDGPGGFADPFAAVGTARGAGAGKLRLVGLMHEGARGRALIETALGTDVYVPGQTVGAERIVSVDARGVTLASRAQRRVMTLADENAP
jgi:hypothetical protein